MSIRTGFHVLIIGVLACGGCATRGGKASPSKLAESMGYPQRTQAAQAGPYQVHYGSDGKQDLLVVARQGRILFIKKGETAAFHAQGRTFANFATIGKDDAVAAYMIHIRDAEGRDAFTLVDEDVDGQFDRKIDYGTNAVYQWENGKWVAPPKAEATAKP